MYCSMDQPAVGRCMSVIQFCAVRTRLSVDDHERVLFEVDTHGGFRPAYKRLVTEQDET